MKSPLKIMYKETSSVHDSSVLTIKCVKSKVFVNVLTGDELD